MTIEEEVAALDEPSPAEMGSVCSNDIGRSCPPTAAIVWAMSSCESLLTGYENLQTHILRMGKGILFKIEMWPPCVEANSVVNWCLQVHENRNFAALVYIWTLFVRGLFSWAAQHTTMCLDNIKINKLMLLWKNRYLNSYLPKVMTHSMLSI